MIDDWLWRKRRRSGLITTALKKFHAFIQPKHFPLHPVHFLLHLNHTAVQIAIVITWIGPSITRPSIPRIRENRKRERNQQSDQ